MKQIYTGSDTVDLGTNVPVPLNGTDTFITNSGDKPFRVKAIVNFVGITIGNTISWQIKLGSVSAATKPIENLSGSFVASVANPIWLSDEFIIGENLTVIDNLRINFVSNEAGGADDSIDITSITYDIDDVSSIGGSDVALTNDLLNVNASLVGGNTPISQAEIEALKGISRIG